jgi:hypothetical protein
MLFLAKMRNGGGGASWLIGTRTYYFVLCAAIFGITQTIFYACIRFF